MQTRCPKCMGARSESEMANDTVAVEVYGIAASKAAASGLSARVKAAETKAGVASTTASAETDDPASEDTSYGVPFERERRARTAVTR